jgi:hypothetical protein
VVLAKYVRTADDEGVKTSLADQAQILPDLPYPFEDGMKTILEDLGRNSPEARTVQPGALIATSVVREAAKGL